MLVQAVVLVIGNTRHRAHDEIGVALEHAPETRPRLETLHQHAAGDALLAGFAVGPVDVRSAAAETDFGEPGVVGAVDVEFRVDEQRLRLLVGQVAARMRLCREKPDVLE